MATLSPAHNTHYNILNYESFLRNKSHSPVLFITLLSVKIINVRVIPLRAKRTMINLIEEVTVSRNTTTTEVRIKEKEDS